MAIFDQCIRYVLKHEDGYVLHPEDPGGATKYGISLRFVLSDAELRESFDVTGDGVVDKADIRAMTEAAAIEVYRAHWWDRYEYWRLASNEVAQRIFSFSVNMGPRNAHRIAQRACRAAGNYSVLRNGAKRHVTEDGILGPITRDAINGAHEYGYLCALRAEAAGHYRQIAERNPKLQTFLAGWLNRAYE